jgi:hypothetical protein
MVIGCTGIVSDPHGNGSGPGFEECLDGFVEGGGLVIHDEVAGVVDADELEVGLGGVGGGVEGCDLLDGTLRCFIGIEEGHRGFDGGELGAEVGAEVFEHSVREDGTVGGEGGGRDLALAFGVFDHAVGVEGLAGGELVVGHGDELIVDGLGLGTDGVDGGGWVKDEAVIGEGVDDEELADVFGVGLGEHEGEEASHGVADDGNGLEVVVGDVLVELLDYGREDGAGGVGACGFSGEACELDEVEAVVCGEKLGFDGVDVARAGEAWDEEYVGSGAAGCAFDDDGEAGGGGGDGLGGGLCGGDGLAEERLAQQKEGGEEEEKREEAESGTGGGLSRRGHDWLLIDS